MLSDIDKDNLIDLEQHISFAGFDLHREAKRIGTLLLHSQVRGIAAPVLYGDEKGSKLYTDFLKERTDRRLEDTAPARIFKDHARTIATRYRDVDRLVIIGAGSYDAFMNQEGALIREVIEQRGKNKKIEVVLVDVSLDFLKENIRALHDLGHEIGADFVVRAIQADFTRISGKKFDQIMREHFDSQSRKNVKTGVISTGATFGNIEEVPNTETIPTGTIDKRMALLGEFGAEGSVIGFDCFSGYDESQGYYRSPKLDEFFLNGLEVIRREGPEEIKGLEIHDEEGALLFTYDPKFYTRSALYAHRLVAQQRQTIQVMNGGNKHVDVDIPQYSTLHMMYSLRPPQDVITSRSTNNTGMTHDVNMGENTGLNFYIFEKTDHRPAVLEKHQMPTLSNRSRRPRATSLIVGNTRPHQIKLAVA